MLDDNLIEKLMELGIGMTMVKQIPDMMNGTLFQHNNITKSAPSHTPPSLNKYTDLKVYIAINGQQAGPFNDSELKLLADKRILTGDVLVWKPSMEQWTPAKYVPEVNKYILLASLDNKVVKGNSYDYKIFSDVSNAMSKLGFNASSTKKAIESVLNSNPNISLEDAIREVLKIL